MRWLVHRFDAEYFVCWRHDPALPSDAARRGLGYRDPGEARRFVLRVQREHGAGWWSVVAAHGGLGAVPSAALVDRLTRAIVEGRLWVIREPARRWRSTRPLGADEEGEEVPDDREVLTPKTWIEIELLDMEGNPVPFKRYWIKLTDGTVREGQLDRAGRAYFGELDPGECEVRWPDMDDEATLVTASVDESGRVHGFFGGSASPEAWIELALIDMEGHAVAGARYELTAPGGRRVRGALDASGVARIAGLQPGACQVRWLDLDQGGLERV